MKSCSKDCYVLNTHKLIPHKRQNILKTHKIKRQAKHIRTRRQPNKTIVHEKVETWN